MERAAPMIRICHLYPRLLSVAGDRGNLLAITKRCAWRGIRSSVTEADVGAVPDFTEFDLILFHGGQDCEMRVAAGDLGMKAGSLREAIEADTAVLAVCAGYQLLGKYYAPADCDLGPGSQRSLVGFENHSGRTYLGPGAAPLGQVIAGSGNNGEDGTEGARYREVYATYLHGPVLPKNPWLTDHLISRALRHRYGNTGPLDSLAPLKDQAEDEAHAATLRLARQRAGWWSTAMAIRPGWRRPGPRRAGTAYRARHSVHSAERERRTAWTSH
jgi:lipid II isoglutaminyl synthase (glutamine-hydrolysing)